MCRDDNFPAANQYVSISSICGPLIYRGEKNSKKKKKGFNSSVLGCILEIICKKNPSLFFFKYFRCIRRIIFNSIVKPTINEKGEKEIDSITTSQALQIAGRAGRYGSSFKQGEVTTMHRDDLMQLKEILSEPVRPVKVRET